jgi:hypothetical protein
MGLTCEASFGLVVVKVSDVCHGKGSFLRHCYWLEVLSSLVPVTGNVCRAPSYYSLGIAMLGGTGMDSLLECSVPVGHGLLPLRPIVAGATRGL